MDIAKNVADPLAIENDSPAAPRFVKTQIEPFPFE